jgi:ACGX-repeat protein
MYNGNYRGQGKSPLNTFRRSLNMALSNLFGWTKKAEVNAAAACGTACGGSDKPEEKPAACGASDKPEEKPAACGSACGAGDK